jgi:biopolymer transport protein ExbB
MTDSSSGFSLLELFVLGGVLMWPLLVYSIAAIALILERIIYLFGHNLVMEDLKLKTQELLLAGKYKEAETFLEGQTERRMGARILLVLVKRAGEGGKVSEHLLEKAVEAEAITCINLLESGFNFLTTLAALSPLTGFLGTVAGMIGAFRSIAEAVDVNAQIVANGIYEALITTVFGLIIAIFAMAAHSIFSHIVDKFAADVEKTCSDLIIEIVERDTIEQGTATPDSPEQNSVEANT